MKLKDKIEVVINELQIEADQLVVIDAKREALENEERRIKALEKALLEHSERVKNREKQADYERDLLTKQSIEINAKKLENQELLTAAQQERHRVIQEKDELSQKITEFEHAEAKFNDFDKKVKEIEFQLQMIDREKTIDRERKKILDLREEKIARRERQLQIEDAAI